MRVAKVKTVASTSNILVPISSEDKPEISEELQKKWQQIVDLAAKIIGVPSGLITRFTEKQLEVFISSQTENNIFTTDMKLELGAGWYCENVVGTRNVQLIPNALKLEDWKDNPSIPFNIISYMGIPIAWPDGEVFGTFCMLDNKENPYSELYKELLLSLREIIQNDLKSVLLYQKAQNDLVNRESQLREVHHRVKNHFNLLISTLSMQFFLNSKESDRESLLRDIQSRIYAVSSIHDKLYHSLHLESVNLGDYLNELGRYIINNLANRHISFCCESDEVIFDTKLSLPAGLILNELITNSLKYAFTKNDDPRISLVIKKDEQELQFTYRDNGIGLKNDFNMNTCETLGMMLISQNVQQLEGKYQILNDNGFVFKMKFRI